MNKVIILDTTMRDGELMPGIKFNLQQKILISNLLEEIGVDVIEVGYPASSYRDLEQVLQISKIINDSTICVLAGAKKEEIISAAQAIKLAKRGRIHTYNNVNLKNKHKIRLEQELESIKDSVSLARNNCSEVEWSAFDAPRSEPDFLCKAIETAIDSGATIVNIPDSLGLSSPQEFSRLLEMIFNRVPNINSSTISVHCHNDLDQAVENSVVSLNCGVRQIECAINGLGARKGNADLGTIVQEIVNLENYQIDVDTSLIGKASDLVAEITCS
ncbi:isopropylmalate/homocitrate/citramalate synthase [Rivularia sp. PCC 7116]|uniref:isopropylmalate/homocitrate/citramalate synthase n=1 Tax=Rivularia sp. PCC 7116 TaxID=373994 RepID=UPI00029F0D3A|nr:isopropylmalate/homocitrate/citramalate synthase [Rivularia sp. PCC 7116]AFY52630.1 isopropylmalate/homocitrate/citramalate synthase [Rivularia sp. PCC 7116]